MGEAARTLSCWLLFVWCVFFIWTLTQFYGCALNSNQVAERIKRSHSQHSLIYASRRERVREMPSRRRLCISYVFYDFFIVFYIIISCNVAHLRCCCCCCERGFVYIFRNIFSLVQAYKYIYKCIVIYRALCFVLSNPRSGVPGNCLAGKGEALVGAAGRMRQRQTPCKHSVLMVGLMRACRKTQFYFLCQSHCTREVAQRKLQELKF